MKKEETKQKYPIGGYAPGHYGCTCVTCKIEFTGDKRAVQCEPCAIKLTKEETKQETLEEAAEKLYPINFVLDYDTNEDIRNIWIEGAKSDAARDYWFEQFKKK